MPKVIQINGGVSSAKQDVPRFWFTV